MLILTIKHVVISSLILNYCRAFFFGTIKKLLGPAQVQLHLSLLLTLNQWTFAYKTWWNIYLYVRVPPLRQLCLLWPQTHQQLLLSCSSWFDIFLLYLSLIVYLDFIMWLYSHEKVCNNPLLCNDWFVRLLSYVSSYACVYCFLSLMISRYKTQAGCGWT